MNHDAPSLNDLNCINREIAALVRAGIPLELGLRGLSNRRALRIERLSARLADRLSEGKTLDDAVSMEGPSVSPVYTAVIKSGLAAGNLPNALESLALSGQILQEVRNQVVLAAIYPMICLAVGYAMFTFIISVPAGSIIQMGDLFKQKWPVEVITFLHERQNYFIYLFPAIVLTTITVLFAFRRTLTRRIWNWITSLRWVVGRSLSWSQFSQLLALQVDHRCALPSAVVLAADSTDDLVWQREARNVSEQLNRGVSLADALEKVHTLPPLVRWMMASGEKQGTLAETLYKVSDTYRRRALRRAAIFKVWLPVFISASFTTVIGLTYGLAMFLPLRTLLEGLMSE